MILNQTLNQLLNQSANTSVDVTHMGRLIIFFVIILSTFIARTIFLYIIDKKVAILLKTKTEINDIIIRAIKNPIGYIILLQGFYIAIIILQLPDKIGQFNTVSIINTIDVVITSFIILYFIFSIIDIVGYYLYKESKKTESALDEQIVSLVIKSLRVLVVTIGILTVIQNFGYNITSLIAGLGIGGLAFALAAQTTLSNLFGSVTIFSDKPFRIGDLVQIGDINGIVEDVAFRTTRIRRLDQALVTVPNSKFVNTEVINYSAMKKRKIEFYLGLTYDTSIDKIKLVVDGIKSIIEDDEKFDHSLYLVRFTDFGEYSLNIYVYCFTTITDFVAFYTIKEELNLKIMRLLENLGVKMAFPSRTVYLH
jgi:MscS family membrane protein